MALISANQGAADALISSAPARPSALMAAYFPDAARK
jgi:hypothetical protein